MLYTGLSTITLSVLADKPDSQTANRIREREEDVRRAIRLGFAHGLHGQRIPHLTVDRKLATKSDRLLYDMAYHLAGKIALDKLAAMSNKHPHETT